MTSPQMGVEEHKQVSLKRRIMNSLIYLLSSIFNISRHVNFFARVIDVFDLRADEKTYQTKWKSGSMHMTNIFFLQIA